MAKADLHLHSKHSNRPSEWVLQRLGAAQSYTEPETVYEKAKAAGMTYVTITDHNTMDGALQLAEKYDDAFTGVQVSSYFADGCKVHLLIWGLNGGQFDEIQRVRPDIRALRDYLLEQKLPHSVAHATYDINNKLTLSHLEQLVLLFDVFESLNGAQNHASNSTWYDYLKALSADKLAQLEARHGIAPQAEDSWVKGFTGGSDDHGGLFIGQTYTMANAGNLDGFLRAIRHKKSFAKGRTNDFHTLAFTVYKVGHDFSRTKSRPLSYTPLASLPDVLFGNGKPSLIDSVLMLGMKAGNQHPWRRQVAEMVEELRRKKVTSVSDNIELVYDRIANIADSMTTSVIEMVVEKANKGDLFGVLKDVSAALPGLFLSAPFFTSLRLINHNMPLLEELRKELPVKRNKRILWFTDTLIDLNGPSVILRNMGWAFYQHGIELRIVSSIEPEEMTADLPPNVINLPYIYKFELPYYDAYQMKIPSVLKAMKVLDEFEPDEIFISTPGPVGLLGLLMAKLMSVRAVGIYHTDYTNELSELTDMDDNTVHTVEEGVRWFFNQVDEIKVPTQSYIDILTTRGIAREKMSVFPRLIDHEVYHRLAPDEWAPYEFPFDNDDPVFLYAGRVSKDKNLAFLLDVIDRVYAEQERINWVFVGDGPYREEMQRRLAKYGDRVHFTGRVPHDELPKLYSQADAFVFPSTTDTFGMVVLEGQCCQLPAFVSDVGGPKEIVLDGETGWVLPALDIDRWTHALLEYAETVHSDPTAGENTRAAAGRNARGRFGLEAVLKNLTSEELVPRPRVLAE